MFSLSEQRAIYLSQLKMELVLNSVHRPQPMAGLPFKMWHDRARRVVAADRDNASEALTRIRSESFREARYELYVLLPDARYRDIKSTDDVVETRIRRLEGRPVVPISFRAFEEGTNREDLNIPNTAEKDQRIREMRELLDKKSRAPGSVTAIGDSISVNLPRRRLTDVSHEELAILIVLYQESRLGWGGSAPVPNFYMNSVVPTLTGEHKTDPAKWTSHCTAVTLGYALCEKEGLDFPPRIADSGYKRVAGLAVNSHPTDHVAARTFKTSAALDILITASGVSPPSEHYPDLVALVARHQETLSAGIMQSNPMRRFVRELPRLLDHGLNIDRFSDLFESILERGCTARQASDATARIACSVYSRKDAPWWFKENFDMRLESWPEGLTRKDFLQQQTHLARIARHAYRSALDLYLPYAKNEGLDKAEVPVKMRMQLAAQIAREYGVGNLKRGAATMEFAMSSLARAPKAEHETVFRRVSSTLSRHKPLTEVIGILEGNDLTFEKPGVLNALVVFGHQARLEKEHKFNCNLTAADLDLLHAGMKLPLDQRGLLPPFVGIENFEPQPLIASSLFNSVRLLGAPSEPLSVVRNGDAVGSWLGFEEQLAREAPPRSRDSVAIVYFKYLARKMPNPYAPPTGLLRVIDQFQNVLAPDYDFPLAHAIEDRDAVELTNQKSSSLRYEVLADLADSRLLGLIDERQFMNACRWVVAGVAPDTRRDIELRSMSDTVQGGYEYWSRRADHFADESFKVWRKLRNVGQEISYRDYMDRDTAALRRHMQRLRSTAQDLSKGRDPENREDRERIKVPYLADEREINRSIESQAASRILDAERAQRNERIAYLMNGMSLVKSVNSLLARRQITVDHAKDFLFSFLQVAIDDTVQNRHLSELSILAFKELPQALSDLYSSGLADALIQRGLRSETGIFPFPPKLVRAFAETRVVISRSAISLSAMDPLDLGQKIATGARAAEAEIRKCFAGVDLTDEEVLRAVKSIYSPRRYLEVSQALSDSRLIRAEEEKAVTTSEVSVLRESARFTKLSAIIGTALAADPVTPPMISPQISWHEAVNTLDAPGRTFTVPPPPPGVSLLSNGAEDRITLLSPDEIWAKVEKWRRDDFGLRWVGGKVHVLHPFDEKRVEFLSHWLGFKSTSFRLIHANKSLLLPPMPSSEELKLLVRFLVQEGIVQSGQPELQVTVTGRLNPEHCAYVGTLKLLTTGVGLRFTEDSFKTTHDNLTGLRLVVFDADQPPHKAPFGAETPGRTDVIGCVDPNDINTCRLAMTLFGHKEEEKEFAALVPGFKSEIREVLNAHGLEHVLKDRWTHRDSNRSDEFDGIRHFHDTIEPLVNAWFDCRERYANTGERSGIIFDMRNVVTRVEKKVKLLQEEMLSDPRYENERKLWFSFDT